MDYRFDGKEVPEESAFATVLNLADGSTGWGSFSSRCPEGPPPRGLHRRFGGAVPGPTGVRPSHLTKRLRARSPNCGPCGVLPAWSEKSEAGETRPAGPTKARGPSREEMRPSGRQRSVTLNSCGLPWDPRFGRAAPSERSEMMVSVPLATASRRSWCGENRPGSLRSSRMAQGPMTRRCLWWQGLSKQAGSHTPV